MWSSPCRRDGEVEKSALRAVTSPLPEEEGLGEKVELSLQERRRGRKVSFFKGKEGRGDFRKTLLLAKDFANECNENSFSNCRVQLAITYLWE